MENQTVFLLNQKKKGGENMKKVLLLTAAIALLAMPAMAGIKETRHNLGMTGDYTYRATGGVTQICVFCHTPHNSVMNILLWNRSMPSGTFQMYTSSGSFSSGNKKSALDTNSISLFCLSCHDGSVALSAKLKNNPEAAPTGLPGRVSRRTNLGGTDGTDVDLRNDHPVNVRLGVAIEQHYGGGDTAKWAAIADFPGNGLRLFKIGNSSDYVECASCHDPHSNAYGRRFLRKSNGSSSLCLTCHKK